MLRRFSMLGQNLGNMRKSPRVADESMFGGGANNAAELPIVNRRSRPRYLKGLVIVCSIVSVPILSLFSCFSQPPHHVHGGNYNINNVNGYEFAQISEMNHLMVSDSMRYAILM